MKHLTAERARSYALSALAMLTGPVHAAWEEIERRDGYRVVIIDKAEVKKVPVYWDALRQVCGKDFCNIAFFRCDTSIAAPKERLSRENLGQALLIYTTNKGFVWNCEVHPHADNCFSW
jgi:hypothetical protein